MLKDKINDIKNKTIDISGIKRVVFGFKNLIDSTFNFSFDYQRENALTSILNTASILLSIASGCTTLSGLIQYAHWIIATLITVGIQVLLYVSSLKIGKTVIPTIRSNKKVKKSDYQQFKFSLFIIWILTMSVSVFFSYSALFIEIYHDDERGANRDILAMTESQKVLNQLDKAIIYKKQNNFDKDIILPKN